MIIPLFLATAYIGQSIYLHSISQFQNLSPLATWPTADGAKTIEKDQINELICGYTMALTALVASVAVNALMTGFILFKSKILKVFLEVKATSVERTFGSLSSNAGDTKLQHIIFIIIESGMVLFAASVQLVRVVLTSLPAVRTDSTVTRTLNLVISIHKMLNVIIRSVHFYFFGFTDNIYLATRASQQQ